MRAAAAGHPRCQQQRPDHAQRRRRQCGGGRACCLDGQEHAAEGGTIVNAMTVAPAQQVMLKVRFLEVARSASREFGVNWSGANNGGEPRL